MYGIFTFDAGRRTRAYPENSFETIVEAGNFIGALREYKYFYVEMDEEHDAADIMADSSIYAIERI